MMTVFIGLDGADPELIEKWKEDLSNFSRLMEEGFFGDLDSIKPPITVPAWRCMLSSKGPEYYGVNDFFRLNGDYETRLVTSSDLRGDSILEKDFKKIGFLIPGTTPGYSIEGGLVSGYLAGDKLEFYPESLGNNISENTELDLFAEKTKRKDNAEETFENSMDAFEWLIKNRDFEVAIGVFQLIDFRMHQVENEEELKSAYEKTDERLGEIMSICEQNNWDLLLASDHGSATTQKKFYLNAWLRDNGYLQYSESENKSTKRLMMRTANFLVNNGLKKPVKKAASFFESATGKKVKPDLGSALDNINFSRSEAFSYLSSGMNYGALYINDGRFEQGSVDDKQELKGEIKESLESEDFIQKVYDNEEIYDNQDMPDLVVEAKEGVAVGPETYQNQFHETSAVVHNRKGMVAGIGPNISEGRVQSDILQIGVSIEALQGEVTLADVEPLETIDKDYDHKVVGSLKEVDL
jgi:predicted AlkP superfamily phosphohydrolase/phosphomutase